VTLTAPASFGFAFESVDPSCSGAADGAVEVTLTGGTAPYEFAWSNASGFESTAEDLIGLEEGWYDVDVTDAAGCLFEASVELVAGSSLEFSLGPDTLICMDQTLLLYGPPSLDYVWQDGSINQFLYIEASEWGVGTYPLYLIVSNDEGCEQSDVMILTIGSCTTGLVDEVSVAMGVYPNPASGRVQWRLPEGACSADVVDAAGRVVVTLTGAMGALDVSDWPVGTYFLKTQGLLGIQEVKRVQVVR
jgi:hypothetical protein